MISIKKENKLLQFPQECTFFYLRVVFRAPWGWVRGVKSICIITQILHCKVLDKYYNLIVNFFLTLNNYSKNTKK